MKNQKGITLIALVITIIVMLILVVVTINVATDGNLFTHAANAAKATNAHVQNEEAILNDELDKSIEEIVSEQTASLIHFTIDETPYTATQDTTWAEWISNKEEFSIDGEWIANTQGAHAYLMINNNANPVRPSHTIQNGGTYSMVDK